MAKNKGKIKFTKTAFYFNGHLFWILERSKTDDNCLKTRVNLRFDSFQQNKNQWCKSSIPDIFDNFKKGPKSRFYFCVTILLFCC